MKISKKLQFLSRATRLFTLSLFLVVALGARAQTGVVFTTLHSFTGTNDGANPVAGLVLGRDGCLYGATEAGGTNGVYSYNNDGVAEDYFTFGTIFKISLTGTLKTLYSFHGTNDSGAPEASLIQGADGNFYGTTYGITGPFYDVLGPGSVFKLTTNGVFTSYVLTSDGYDIGNLVSSLAEGSDGNFYGTSPDSVFEMTTNGVVAVLDAFDASDDDGFDLEGPLLQAKDGYFYGTTANGGPGWLSNSRLNNAVGEVFKINTNGAVTWIYAFNGTNTGAGSSPRSGLVQGSDGYFYGTCSGYDSGAPFHNNGNVFKMSPDGVLTVLHPFNGERPNPGLTLGDDGSLYGITEIGGSNAGTIFKLNPDGSGFMTLHSFAPSQTVESSGLTTNSDGAIPTASLLLVSNTLYGTTAYGGIYGYGTIFSLTLPGPQLTLAAASGNIVLSWPTNATGLTLQFATNLVPPIVWNSNTTAPTVIGNQNVVTNAATGTQMFFRLSP